MSSTIVVPELSESVTEARVGRWLKKKGDHVSAGDVLVELETDKVDLEVGADTTGVISKILHEEGDEVQVGDELAVIEPKESGEEVTEERAEDEAPDETREEEEKKDKKKTKKSGKKREAAEEDQERDEAKEKGREEADRKEAVKEDEEEEAEEARRGEEVPKPASPSARRLARERDVDLAAVRDETDKDRIGREDVERFLERRKKDESKTRERRTEEPSRDGRREERIRMSGRRRTIARRLVEAQRNAAMLTTFNEVDMSAVLALRESQQESFVERHGVRLGIVSFFVRASIGALRDFPHLNAEIQDDEIVLKHYYDIGIAVGDPEGLVVPVVRDADRLSLAQIERHIKELAAKAEERRLSPEELSGGTFTITNGGVFGSLLSTPILNPPQVGILGLHKIEDRPFVIDGRVQVRPMMYLALSYDHRVVDGLEAVQFLVSVKELVESPERLLLEG